MSSPTHTPAPAGALPPDSAAPTDPGVPDGCADSGDLLPVLLTSDELTMLRSVLTRVSKSPAVQSGAAAQLLAALDSRQMDDPEHEYVLAGPWGTIREGAGTWAETLSGCRQARADHWASGHGRDERYDQIQVERITTRYVSDTDGNDLGRFISASVTVDVPDAPLTAEQQAENEQRLAAGRRFTEHLYSELRLRMTPQEDPG